MHGTFIHSVSNFLVHELLYMMDCFTTSGEGGWGSEVHFVWPLKTQRGCLCLKLRCC